MATAYAGIDYSNVDLWRGEVEDLTFGWHVRRMKTSASGYPYGVTATGANGSGWSAIGETASAFTFWIPLGLSALGSGTAQVWSAYSTASAGATAANASASSLIRVESTVRVSATGGAGPYLISARMRTSSGRDLREVVSASIVG